MSPCFFIIFRRNHIQGKGAVMADWAKIKAEYIRGGISTRKLAEKHGVSYTTLAKKCCKENWTAHRQRAESKGTERIVDACATKEAEKAIRIYEAADIALTVVIERLMMDPALNAQDIKSLTGALKDIAAVKGIQTDAERREQEARIAKLRREAEREDQEKTIELVVPDELKRFCR